MKLPLVAVTAAAAGVLMTSVALHERAVVTERPSAPPGIVVDSVKNDQAALHQMRDIVHVRQLEPDYRSDSPGIYLG